HEHLDAAGAGQAFQFGKPVDVVAGAADPEREIAEHALAGPAKLVLERGLFDRRRHRVGHFEDGGHAALDRRPAAGVQVFLVLVARFAEVHLAVDDAGQDVQPGEVEHLGGEIRPEAADVGDAAVADRDVALGNAVLVDDHPAAQDEIEGFRHVLPLVRLASPPPGAYILARNDPSTKPADMATPFVATLADRAVLTAEGPDTSRFLQGLITADVGRIDSGRAAYAALLTPQGKILFDFFVVKAGERYLIDCAADRAGELLKRLMFYRLRAKVDLAADEVLAVAALWNGTTADEPGNVREVAGGVAFADPRTPAMGSRVIAPAEAIAAFAGSLGAQAASAA